MSDGTTCTLIPGEDDHLAIQHDEDFGSAVGGTSTKASHGESFVVEHAAKRDVAQHDVLADGSRHPNRGAAARGHMNATRENHSRLHSIRIRPW